MQNGPFPRGYYSKRSAMSASWRVHAVSVGNRTRYRIGHSPSFVGWSHPLYCAMKMLAESDRMKAKLAPNIDDGLKHVNRMFELLEEKYGDELHVSGVYLLSLVDANGLEHSMYVGQSRNLPIRVQQHQENIHKALTLLPNNFPSLWPKEREKWVKRLGDDGLSEMYADLAEGISFGDRLFVHQWHFPVGLVRYAYRCNSAAISRKSDPHAVLNECLCICEQHLMDCFRPRLNVIAARMPVKHSK